MGLRGTVGGCLVVAIVLAGAGPAAAHPDRPAAADAARPRTVTLITGDRVVVADGGAGLAGVEPGPGRVHVRFLSRRIAGHLQVVPVDALPLLHADRLDPRLFDVTALLAYGYDDARADLPLIVTYPRGVAGATASIAGARLVRDMPAVHASAIRQPRARAGAFWADLVGRAAPAAAQGPAAKIWLDARRRYTLDVSVPLIGAPAAHRAGFTGAGVTVAVLDTGVDASHPDLAGRVAGERNFTEGAENDLDHVGHGTHVASTVAGSGAASGGRFAGVAPGAALLDGKVCVVDGCAESWILAGMQWAAAERHAKVVNMSLAGPDTPETDPVEQAVETLTARFGTLFVVAAGNEGADGTVGSPGTADAALSVGATTKADELAFFSSRGPRAGDSALKPDITAPGVDITAARSSDGELGEPGERYMSLSGTSMATPHVAGSAAILAQRHPDWSPAALKAGLMAAAKPNPAIGVYSQGAGRVDIGRAVTQTVTAGPPSVSFGRTSFPHTDDTPITRTVTYHNHGPATVTLDLALHTTSANGEPTAPGMFTLGADRVTIPAGRDATVRVTADTSVAGPTGFAGGTITGTARGLVVQTPLAVDLEEESYDLTLAVTDRSGSATDRYSAMVFSVDRNVTYLPHDPDGTATVRLPRGRYLLYTNVFDGDEEDPDATQLVQPALDLTRTTTVAMDARLGRPVSVSVQRPSATPRLVQVGFAFGTPTASTGADMVVGGFDGLFTAQIGGRRRVDGFVSFVVSQWGDARAGRFSYGLAFPEQGRMFTGFRRRVADRDLATVRLSLVAQASGSQGTRTTLGVLPGVGITVGAAFTYDLPATPTELYNTDGGVRWEMEFVEQTAGPEPEPLGTLRAPPLALRAGRTTHQTWNAAVVGPAFPRPPAPELWATRTGDSISVSLPVFSDGAGHAGSGRTDSGHTTLSRDGVVVGESPDVGFVFAAVPPGEARYRLETAAERGAPFLFSTRVRYVWTFRSGHVDGEAPRALPLSAIRFTPALDDHNTAPRGGEFPIPVSVDRHPGSSAGSNRTLTVQVSFDDGTTWRRARLVRGPDGIVALVRHPDRRGYVSLRAGATDSAGNTVTETVIRAYRIA